MQVLDCFVGDARLNLVAQWAWIICAMLFMYDDKKTSKMFPDICAPSPAGLQRSCEFLCKRLVDLLYGQRFSFLF